MGNREVNGVAILDWPDGQNLPPLVVEVRALLESGESASGVLVDMSSCTGLGADQLEALTEALRMCQDRQATIGLFGVPFAVQQLLGILGVEEDLPPILGDQEADALTSLNGGGSAAQGSVLEFEIDLSPTAPTQRFEPQSQTIELPSAVAAGGSAPTARFDPAALEQAPPSEGGGLLTVFWADLASQGYVIGGEGGELIMAAVADLGPATSPTEEPGVIDIDLGDVVPATNPGGPNRGAATTTEKIPVFDFSSATEDEAWSAQPTAGAVEIDFGGGAGLDAGTGGGTGLFGGGVGDGFGSEGDFSPVDTGSGPPPGILQEGGEPVANPSAFQADPNSFEDSDETVMFQPGALDQALLQASLEAAAAAEAPTADFNAETVAVPPPTPSAPPTATQPLSTQPLSTQTPSGTPREAAVPPPSMVPSVSDSGPYGLDSDDETVMIQPGMLDAALLAEVAKAAGSETELPSPPVETPPPAPSPVASAPAGAPTAGFSMPDGREVELRLFLHDYAITSETHLMVLDRFAQQSEKTLGPRDLNAASGGSELQPVLDQFVQSRLLRRTRSPRVRGGSGFVFSPSPQVRNTIVRLLRMWGDPQGRAKLTGWFQGQL